VADVLSAAAIDIENTGSLEIARTFDMMKPSITMEPWLTSKRLRTHGLLLLVTLWSFYFWTLATPNLRDRDGNLKGTDFLHLYTLGTLASGHRGGDLYDINRQAAVAAQRVPDAAGIRYLPLYPPQVSIFFIPLAHLSYRSALIGWWVCTSVIYGLCCYCVWRACPGLHESGWTVALLTAAYPAFFHLFAWGQTSAIALACFTLLFLSLRNRKYFIAGIALGCLIFKPQLALAGTILFIALGRWKLLAGSLLSATIQVLVGVFYYGMRPFGSWLRTLLTVRSTMPAFEPRPYQTHCLRTFWSMIVPSDSLSFALYVLSAAIVLGWTITLWRRRAILPLRFSALLLSTVLVSPHLTVYDLVILAPAFLLLADWLISQPAAGFGMGTLLYLVYFLPLVGPFTRWIHVQLSVVAMTALVYMIWRLCMGNVPGNVVPIGTTNAAAQARGATSVDRKEM